MRWRAGGYWLEANKMKLIHNPSTKSRTSRVIDLDREPSPTILSGDLLGDNRSHYFLEGNFDKAKDEKRKPPYRVPPMAEIAKVKKNRYSVISCFSGAGGSCLGYRMAGFKVLWANEFEPNAAECYRLNFPDSILDTRDVRRIKPEEILKAVGKKRGEIDLLDGSPPCFEAGTPVVTVRGIVPIEAVRSGDTVLTHMGRWRKVVTTMVRSAPTIVVDGRIRVTTGHKFLARKSGRTWDNSRRMYRRTLAEPQWERADSVRGMFCATPAAVEPVEIPPAPKGFVYSDEFWYIVGRWVGDGWVRIAEADPSPPSKRLPQNQSPVTCRCGKSSIKSRRTKLYTNYCGNAACRKSGRKRPRYATAICTSRDDAAVLKTAMSKLGVKVGETTERTVAKLWISRRALTEWLPRWFGSGAAAKTLPGWTFGMPESWRRSLLSGYRDADGDDPTTVSRCLVVSMGLLSNTLGFTFGIDGPYQNKKTHIEGRPVKARPQYRLGIFHNDGRYTDRDGVTGHRWRKIRRETKPGSSLARVYDIEVEEDHSFIADTFAVHNCQSFSTAGKREKGWGKIQAHGDGTTQQSDDLFFEFARILRGLQPKVFVAENVSGLAKGYFKEIFAALENCGYAVKARLLDAQWLGVPQARQRIFFVGVRRNLTEKFGVGPAFPEPLPYRYSVLDAIGDLLRKDEKPEKPEKPSPTITAHICADTGFNPPLKVKVRLGEGFGHERWADARIIPAQTIGAGPASGNNLNNNSGAIEIDRRQFSVSYLRGKVGPTSKWKPQNRTLTKAEPRFTISASDTKYLKITEDFVRRKFTIPELKRICGFPDNFVLIGSYAQQWARLGNSVPPLMATAVAAAVRDEILAKLR